MYIRTGEGLAQLPTSYLSDSSINGFEEYGLGQAAANLYQEMGGLPEAVDPFPSSPYVLGLEMTNQAFSNCAGEIEKDPDSNAMCGAVADLTGHPDLPPFYAHNPLDMVYVASLAKLYPMYVAFELRKRVRQQLRDMITLGLSTSTAGWENQVWATLEKAWKPKVKAVFPSLPDGFPKLREIFVLSSTGEVKFAANDPPLTNADLDFRPPNPTPGHPPVSPEFKTPPGKFWDWMRLMLRWSNNEAASRCIQALSYPYINGMLTRAGFFNRTSKVGLWLSGDYLGKDWLKANGAGQPLSPRWARLQRRKVTNFAGTAFQVARLLTLLAQERLVDKPSSREMQSIMTGAAGIGSYIRGALFNASPPRPFSSIASKIGCGDEVPAPACGFSHDCAIVKVDRGDPARNLCYVVVALGGHPNKGKADLRKMGVRFHDCIAGRHP
jgi:D-alanyl-D-alanine carboxypeptidase